LRVWITNTVEDQVWQGSGDLNVDAFDFSPNMEASYRVKIEGRLLDEDDDADSPKDSNEQDGDKMDEDAPDSDKKAGPSSSKPRFSHFFKEINVEFDKQRYRNGADQAIEWKRPEPGARAQPGANQAADFDEFTFKRNGDENLNITINLHRFEVPERYSLSPELSDIVDMKEGTQHEVVMGLWEYIRMNGLQEDEEKRNFRCDELLKRVSTLVNKFLWHN
jgi:chromatin remodeling complex protein RSC6